VLGHGLGQQREVPPLDQRFHLEFDRPGPLQHHVVVRQRLAAVFARLDLGNQLVFIGAEVERGVGLLPGIEQLRRRFDLECAGPAPVQK
jgi:hypothetical protein